MEIINQSTLRTDKSLLIITHISQLLCYIIGFGGLLAPLIIWAVTKEKVIGMNEQGRNIINFQLSLILYVIISIPAILLLGLGILMLIGIAILGFAIPIINAVKVSNGEEPTYFMTIKII